MTVKIHSSRLVLAALAVLVLVLAACGGAEGDDTAADGTPGGDGAPAEGSGIVLADEVDTDELYGIGVQQGADALRSAINAALADIVDDGTYEELYQRWFPGGDVQEQLGAIAENATGGEIGDPAEYGLQQEGRMLVGSDIAFAPFEFVEDGENKGFDIDLMNEIGDRLGLEIEFVNTSFDTIFTQLAAGQFDAIISAITITEERDETIDFSDPYFLATQGLAVVEGSDIGGVEDLAGKTVAVQSGTTGEAYANENFTDADVQAFPTSEAGFTALLAGQVDAVFIDLPVVSEAAARGVETEDAATSTEG